jgi:DNA-binding NarL/FixJ family response regulator
MIRVILADDHVIFRQGLLKLLQSSKDIEVAGEAGTGPETMNLVTSEKPDIAILDISMPGFDGFEILQRIQSQAINTKVIFLTMYKDTLMARKALQSGASGYILKDNAFSDLLYAISTVSSGGTFISPSVSRSFVNASDTEDKESQYLTLRESEVLKLIASGLTNKQIADKLFISIKTVETHRKNIMQKLDVHTIADLVKYTIKTGLLDIE